MTDSELIAAASLVQERAYSPYSRFSVGAALLTDDGRVFTGVNVENLSFGLTMCAERVALGSGIQAGARKFVRLAITATSKLPIVPCGACRQVLAEFNPMLTIISAAADGQIQTFELKDLLPLPRQGILE